MISARRHTLANIPPPKNKSHAGLWFDKFLTGHPEERDERSKDKPLPYSQLVNECCAIGEPADYKSFFARWEDTLKGMGVQSRVVKVNGRIAIGLGNASTIETGATLHHTYGVPYIPGSGLKGMTAAYARQHLGKADWGKGSDAYKTLFGTTDSTGYVTFFDALPCPGKWKLLPDIITVHHPEYYQGQKGSAPADWDSPTPIPFLSVTGSFLVALGGQYPLWNESAYNILEIALTEKGVGAKTSSGYGRIVRPSSKSESIAPQDPFVAGIEARLNALTSQSAPGQLPQISKQVMQMDTTPEIRCHLVNLLLKSVRDFKREKKARSKSWYSELVEFVENSC